MMAANAAMRSSTAETSESTEPISICVLYYWGIKPQTFSVTTNDTCEHVIFKCLEYIKDKVCAADTTDLAMYVPAFGLRLKLQPGQEEVWLPFCYTFDKAKNESVYQFRVRFRPPLDMFNKNMGDILCSYFFVQALEDFLHGPLVESKKFESQEDKKNLYRLLVISLLIPKRVRLSNNTVIDKKFTARKFNIFTLTKCFSAEIAKVFLTQRFFDHFWINHYLHNDIQKLKYSSPSKTLECYQAEFFRLLAKVAPRYCFEEYRVEPKTGDTSVTFVTPSLRLYEPKSGLYYFETFQFPLEDIQSVNLTKPTDSKDMKWKVEIILKSKSPEILLFKEEGAAESFVSMLQGYYNLCVRYDYNLCSELQTARAKNSAELRSFGPIRPGTIDSFLKTKEANVEGFLIHESTQTFPDYHVVFWTSAPPTGQQPARESAPPTGQQPARESTLKGVRIGTIKCSGSSFVLTTEENKTNQFKCALDLRQHLSAKYKDQLLPRNMAVTADINNQYETIMDYIPDARKTEEPNSSLLVILKEDLTLSSDPILDWNPEFLKYKARVKDDDMMFLSLQSSDEVAKHFRGGLEKLIKLRRLRPNYFLQFHCMVLDRQFSVLMELPICDMLTYICTKKPSIAQKVDIISQIINILLTLKNIELFHGNMRLRKFHACKGERSINVKLADPGVSSYHDTLPLTDLRNIERLPYLSPERRLKLDEITFVSELYSIGTVLTEILYKTDQFRTELKIGTDQQFADYFKEKNLPKPKNLSEEMADKGKNLLPEVKEVYTFVWEMIQKCWEKNTVDRPTLKAFLDFVKDLNKMTEGMRLETEQDELEEVVEVLYNTGMPTLPGSTQKTYHELETKFKKYMGSKYLPPECIDLEFSEKKKLGEGHYGVVYAGDMTKPRKDASENQEPWQKAAFKLNFRRQEVSLGSIYKEIIMTCELNHPNIVKLFHLASLPNSASKRYFDCMLVMEYMNKGSLSQYAKKKGPISSQVDVLGMLNILLDVVKGMVYLSGQSVVHRDLAARNILLHENADKTLTAKVSDFGLARNMEGSYNFYVLHNGESLPFIWMPPECLVMDGKNDRFKSKGDVWSFGIVMWESFSGGDHPVNFMAKNTQPEQLLEKYKRGWRLPAGKNMNKDVYSFMERCWNINIEERPSFVTIDVDLTELKKNFAAHNSVNHN